MAPVAGVRTEGRLSVPGTVVVVNGKIPWFFLLKRCTRSRLTLVAPLSCLAVPWLSRIGVRTNVGRSVKLLVLVVGVVATGVLIT